MSIAALGYEIDSSQALTAERNLDRMNDAAWRAGAGAGELEKQSSSLSETLRALTPIAARLAGSLAAMFSVRAVINAAEQYETRMARINAVIQATGGVAGRTAEQLERQAQSLAHDTLESVDGVMQAQQVLLTFRNVQGEVFDRAIESAADMAAAMGGDVVSATLQLARALEDPINGVTALTRSGTVFTREQRDMIRAMVESGRTAEAQAFILSELEAQYGGVARAAGGLTAAKNSLGRSYTNLLISINDQLGLTDGLANAYNMLAGAVQWLADNLELARGYIIAGALAITTYYIPALIRAAPLVYSWVAANVALIASFTALKAALIAIGIGAFIVLAGTAINYLLRLRVATGSWGEVFGLVRDLVTEVMARISQRVEAVEQRINAFAFGVRSGFLDAAAGVVDGLSSAVSAVDVGITSLVNIAINAVESMVNVAIDGLNAIIDLVNKIPGVDIGRAGQFGGGGIESLLGGASNALDGLSGSLREQSAMSRQAAIDAGVYSDILTELAGRPLQSVQAIRDVLSETADDTELNTQRMVDAVTSINDALGGAGGADDGFAGRLAALAQQFQTERELVEQWYQEAQAILADRRAQEILGEEEHRRLLLQVEELYQRQLAAIRANAQAAQLGHTADFFGAMAEVAQQGGESMTRVARAFGAAQALINTYVAASQVLADPSLGFFAKFAAVARVIAAGMGLVNAIRGGITSAASPSSASGVTQQQTPLRRTIVELRGPDWVKGIIQPVMEQIYDASRDGEKVIFAR